MNDTRKIQRILARGLRLALPLLVLMALLGGIDRGEAEEQSSSSRPGLIERLKLIQRESLKCDYGYRQAAYLCNNIGPRLSGSPQNRSAAEYVAQQLRQIGLEARLEKVRVPYWIRGEEKGELIEYVGRVPGTTQKIALTALGNSVATAEDGLQAEVVVARDLDELQGFSRSRVEGKIVLMNKPFDERMARQGFGVDAYEQVFYYRFRTAVEAAKLGAVAALVRSIGMGGDRLPHTGSMRYDPNVVKIPTAAVATEDADLMAYLGSQGPIKMRLVLTPKTLPDADSYNVVADLPGAQFPDQFVLVSGHLDSWDLGTGALDDAAGVAMSMQTIYLLKRLGLQPSRTIRMVAWTGEENGSPGAWAYAELHKAHIARHFAAIESDLGAGRPLGINVIGNPNLLELLSPIAQTLEAQGAGILRISENVDADLAPLHYAGIPCFSLIQDSRTYFKYHHSAADTFDKINPSELAENASVMAVLAYGLSELPNPPPQ